MPRELDARQMQEAADELIEALASEEFRKRLQKVKDAPQEEKLEEASRQLNPESLREVGVPFPEGARVSSRFFEESSGEMLELGNIPGETNVLNELNKSRPGFLDEIRHENPGVYRKIVRPDVHPQFDEGPMIDETVGWWFCGGGWGFCAGGGS